DRDQRVRGLHRAVADRERPGPGPVPEQGRRADRHLCPVRLRQLQLDRDPDRRHRWPGPGAPPGPGALRPARGARWLGGHLHDRDHRGCTVAFRLSIAVRRVPRAPGRSPPPISRRNRGPMNPVIVVGSFNVDHVWRCNELPATGATIAGQYMTGPGGKGVNQAVACARSGAPTTFICALGDDAGGAIARELAAADGIDLRAEASSEPTGTAGIYVDARGRNTIVIGAGANGVLGAAHVTADPALARAADVLLAQLESPAEAIEAALA